MELSKKAFLIVALAFYSVVALCEAVPHIFSNGQRAYAEHVNENFKYLIDRDREYTVLVNGVKVGTSSYIYGAVISLKTFNHYDLSIYKDGRINEKQAYYKNNSCSGTGYFNIDTSTRQKFYFTGRNGIIAHVNGVSYYSRPDAQLYGFTAYSYEYNGVCNQINSSGVFAIAKVNDQNITGFPDTISTIQIEGETENRIIEE